MMKSLKVGEAVTVRMLGGSVEQAVFEKHWSSYGIDCYELRTESGEFIIAVVGRMPCNPHECSFVDTSEAQS